jgi:hypothetical protein
MPFRGMAFQGEATGLATPEFDRDTKHPLRAAARKESCGLSVLFDRPVAQA